jgi:AcrR family transcriptional regulator
MNETAETSAATAAILVRTARHLFAQNGYDGTSVRAITGAAGANLGAITYHFGSKRELYDRVVESVVLPLAERVEVVMAAEGDVLDRAEGIVRAYFDYLADNPDLPRLMMQELVLGGGPGQAVAAPLKRVHGALWRVIEEGQAAGVIRPGPPAVLGLFILSVPVHMGILQRPLQMVGLDLLEPAVRGMVVESAVAFVRGGLSETTEDGR